MDQINTDLKCDEKGIFYFGDYLNMDMGGAADPYTRKILDLKARSSDAVAYFSGIMDEFLYETFTKDQVKDPEEQPLDSFADLVISFVPSSNSENIKTGLYDLLDTIKEFNEVIDPMCSVAPNAFIRHTTIPKSQARERDRRDYEIHYNSISMNMNANVFTAEGTTVKLDAGMPLLIIDDVSTTGTSLLSLRKIAIRNGFKRVYLLALGRTKSRYD